MFKSKGIKFHIFINTCIIFFILFSIQFIAQFILFKSFYIYFTVSSMKDDFSQLFTQFESVESDKEINDLLNDFSIQTNTNNSILNFRSPVITEEHLITLEIETEHGDVLLYAMPDIQYNFLTNTNISFQGVKHNSKNLYFPTMISIDDTLIFGKEIVTYDNQMIKQHLNSSQIDNFNFYFLFENSGRIKSIKQPTEILSLEHKMVLKELPQLATSFQDSKNLNDFKIDNDTVGTYYSIKDDDNGNHIVFVTDVIINHRTYSLVTIASLLPSSTVSTVILLFNFTFGGILFLLSLILASISARKISRPIHDLIHFTTEKVYYEINDEITLEENLDISQLSNHFNKLFKTAKNAKYQSDQQQIKLIELLKHEKLNQELISGLIRDLTREIIDPFNQMSQNLTHGLYEEASNDLKNLDNLMKDLDLIRKLEKSTQKDKKTQFNIKFLINKVLLDCETILKQKNIIIQLNLENTTVLGNRPYIYHVIKNLLLTAIDYANNDNFVYISLKQGDETVRIEFQVPGISLTDNTLNTMFEPVNPLGDVLSNINFVSLYVVRLILENHNQKFGVYNTKEGFIQYFTLELPISFSYL